MHLQPFGSCGPRGLPAEKQVEMIYMDIFKAFDKVNHGCLLSKSFASSDLEAASCNGLALT